MTAVASLIVAAGQGSRLGAETPKQYLSLGGIPILRRSVMAYRARGPLRVVIRPDDRALYDAAVAGLDLLEPVPGGATRQDSVRLGLESLAPLSPAAVLIHDAARPFVDDATIDRTIDALGAADAAIAALPVVDTLKREDRAGAIGETVPREGLWRAQTPQAFRFDAILAAHRAAAGRGLTDDAAVAEAAGLTVRLVLGDERNFKITTADDLARAERQYAAERWADLPEVRVGQGYDVHRLGPGTAVTLCGVRLDHDRALIGHSDADVGLHAITDALLGTIGAGDIGSHFPPGDPRWKGADSAVFLRHAAALVRGRGGRIVHVDVTLICERPKVGPHRETMRARIADILGLEVDRVSVKATTTEGLGFAGRREGIAAQALATVAL